MPFFQNFDALFPLKFDYFIARILALGSFCFQFLNISNELLPVFQQEHKTVEGRNYKEGMPG